jgi:hypothetical protein
LETQHLTPTTGKKLSILNREAPPKKEVDGNIFKDNRGKLFRESNMGSK